MLGLLFTAALVTLLYAPVTIGLAIAFRMVNYPDLTCEGSFIVGGALSLFALEAGLHPGVSLAIGVAGGVASGGLTAALHTRLKVSRLLSGIITSAILYSVTIHLLGGRANRMVRQATIFDSIRLTNSDLRDFLVAGAIVILVLAFCRGLYSSHVGRVLRALGDQEWFCISLGKNVKTYLVVGLAIANALTALSGATLMHFKRVCDVNMGFGVLIAALAGLVLGETVYPARSVWGHTLTCLGGTGIYNVALGAFYFEWGGGVERFLLPSDVRLVTGLLLIIPALIVLRGKPRYRLFSSNW